MSDPESGGIRGTPGGAARLGFLRRIPPSVSYLTLLWENHCCRHRRIQPAVQIWFLKQGAPRAARVLNLSSPYTSTCTLLVSL